MSRDPTCVFRVDPGLVAALEGAFGPPIDSYLAGWQVWIEPGPNDAELEYRLHPPAGFRQPVGLSHHDLWDEVVAQLADGGEELRLGEEVRSLADVWVLLEVYPAFGEELDPEQVRAAAEEALGRPALAAGRADHTSLGSQWKRARGRFDLTAALLEELGAADG